MNRITQYFASDDLFAVSDFDETMLAFGGSKFGPDAGLNFHRARHFDPTPGRWLSEGPVGFSGEDNDLQPYVG